MTYKLQGWTEVWHFKKVNDLQTSDQEMHTANLLGSTTSRQRKWPADRIFHPQSSPFHYYEKPPSPTPLAHSPSSAETVALPLLWRRLSAFSHLHAVSNPYLTESSEKIKSSRQPTLGECSWVPSPGSCQDVMCGAMLGIGLTGRIRKQHWAETQPVSRRPKIN